MMTKLFASLGDRLSPMLVKEVRQGMRGGVFVGSFLLLQGIMILAVLAMLYAVAENDGTEFGTGLFWACIGVPLLAVMPLTGLGALGGEIKSNTLELIFLTRLSAWRIVLGKWAALFVQSLLLVSAVLPYLVLRYFVGGVNIMTELQVLGILLLASAVLCAVSVGVSPFPSVLVRIGLIIGLFVGLQVVPGLFMVIGMGGGSFFRVSGSANFYLVILVMAPLILLLMLSVAAGKIAPPAENYAARKRLLGFVALVAAAIVSAIEPDSGGLLLVLLPLILLPLLIGALCENQVMIPIIYARHARFGWLGRMAGRFLYPGWPSGVLFSLVILGFYAWLLGGLLGRGSSDEMKVWLGFVALAGALFLPLFLTQIFSRRTTKRLPLFFLFQTIMLVAAIVVPLTGRLMDAKINAILAPLPGSVFVLLISGNIDSHELEFFANVTGLISVLVTLGCIVMAFMSFGRVKPLEVAPPKPATAPLEPAPEMPAR